VRLRIRHSPRPLWADEIWTTRAQRAAGMRGCAGLRPHPSRRAQERAPQDEGLPIPHGEERGGAARLEPRGPDASGCLKTESERRSHCSGGFTVIPGRAQQSPLHLSRLRGRSSRAIARDGWGLAATLVSYRSSSRPPPQPSPASGRGSSPALRQELRRTHFAFPARLSRNTPCSPNMFQNHHGAMSRNGRP